MMTVSTRAAVAGLLLSAALQQAGATLEFSGVPPTQAGEAPVVSETAVVDGTTVDTEYAVLARRGDVFGEAVWGQLLTVDGEPAATDNNPSNNEDYTSLLPYKDTVYMVAQFESPSPSSSYFAKAKQGKDGEIEIESAEIMDWTEYGGLANPCAGSTSPWKSHLGSEEYTTNARTYTPGTLPGSSWAAYYGTTDASKFFPYNFGYVWEAIVDFKSGALKSNVKHMAMGRLNVEAAIVMPDWKTVYITDDFTNGILAMFVASKAGDLSCGTLYAAKFVQTSADGEGPDAAGGGTFDISWIKVGEEACDDTFKAKAPRITFSDIFETAAGDAAKGTCPAGFTGVNTSGTFECLKLKEGMELWASRFECRRWAQMKGATAEFTKWEGITLDTKDNALYTSMSYVRTSMEDKMAFGVPSNKYDAGTANAVRLPLNLCGCLNRLDLDANYQATKMTAVLCGEPNKEQATNTVCANDNIANPDNVHYVAGHHGLVVNEDGEHDNAMIWYYDLTKSGKDALTRVATAPAGAEWTSGYFYPNINGYAYILDVVQHPDDQGMYLGYVKLPARKDTCNMASKDGRCGKQLWNDYPVARAGSSGMGEGGVVKPK